MTNKQRCYESLNTLSDGLLCSWIAGSYRRHLPTSGTIVEIQVISDTCLRITDNPDSGSNRATIVEYQVNHQTREAELLWSIAMIELSLASILAIDLLYIVYLLIRFSNKLKVTRFNNEFKISGLL